MSEETIRSCIDCGTESCNFMDGKFPPFCLTTHMDEAVLQEAMNLYTEDEENYKVATVSAEVETDYYCQATRIQETVEFARRMGYKKIGIANCLGLLREARVAAQIFRNAGFEVYGVGCKVGAQPKETIGIPEKCKATGVNMCNPILQAKLLNAQKTELNVLIGLCVGHDSMFYKYSDALVTTLVVKDRVLGHNPVAGLQLTNSYYRKLLDL